MLIQKGKGKLNEEVFIREKNPRKRYKRSNNFVAHKTEHRRKSEHVTAENGHPRINNKGRRNGENQSARSLHSWKNKFVSRNPSSRRFFSCKGYGHRESECRNRLMRNLDAYEHKCQMVDLCIDQLQSMGARMFMLSQVIGMLYVIVVTKLVIRVMSAEKNTFNHMATPTHTLSTNIQCITTMASMKEWIEPMLDKDTHGTKIEGCLIC